MTKFKDYFGKVTFLQTNKGFGFVSSENDNNKYYFKTYSCNETLKLNDRVAFCLTNNKKGMRATAIRKIHTNRHGIKFIPRVNSNHIHVVLGSNTEGLFNKITSLKEEFIEIEYKSPDIVGKSTCVITTPDDKIVYAIRKTRQGHSRFVLDRTPIDSSYITGVFLKKGNYYMIVAVYVGPKSGKEPYDKNATENDFKFWENHALLFDKEDIIKGSETKTCPWVLNQPAIPRINQN